MSGRELLAFLRRARRAWLLPLGVAAVAAASQSCSAGSGGAKVQNGTGGGAASSSASSGSSSGAFDLQCSAAPVGSPLLRRLTSNEFQTTLSAVFPDAEFPGLSKLWTSSLPADIVSAYGFDNDQSAVVGLQYAQALLATATSLATAITTMVTAPSLTCLAGTIDATCATQFIEKYGRRLFRRSLTTSEENRYVQFFTTSAAQADPKRALLWTIVGLVQSPNTVYRSEIGAVGSDGLRHLGATEVAAELAYTYTGRPPDDALIAKAEASGSSVVGDAVAWAKAALTTPAGQQALQQFFQGYLGYTQVVAIEKANIAGFDAAKPDMVTETQDFIQHVIFNGKSVSGGLSDLLTSPTTYVTPNLAAYYGFPAPGANGAVVRPAGKGIGLLAQGSFLASNSGPDSSSPTLRGLLVFQKLLCETKRNPPPNVPPIAPPAPGIMTTRQRYEEHDKSGCTTGCHNFFDPIGFGFEQFDEGGRHRATDNGLPIDTASDVPNPDRQGPLFSFANEEALAQGLAKQELSYACFGAYLATYAFGTSEACLGSAQVSEFSGNKIGIAELFAGLAGAPHFTTRTKQ